jgi:flagellar basal-body rod protein FlgG
MHARAHSTSVQAAAGGVPGPAVPEPAARRLGVLRRRHHRATGVQLGLGVKTAAIYRIADQGSHHADREPARPGDARPRLPPWSSCPTATPPIPAPAACSSAPTATSSPPTATSCSRASPSRRRDRCLDQRERRGLAKLSGQVAPARRSAGAGELRQRGRPRRHRREPAPGDRGVRPGQPAPPAGRLRHHAPGLPGDLQRQRGPGVTNLITAQRAYEMNSKVIEASDEMMTQLR